MSAESPAKHRSEIALIGLRALRSDDDQPLDASVERYINAAFQSHAPPALAQFLTDIARNADALAKSHEEEQIRAACYKEQLEQVQRQWNLVVEALLKGQHQSVREPQPATILGKRKRSALDEALARQQKEEETAAASTRMAKTLAEELTATTAQTLRETAFFF